MKIFVTGGSGYCGARMVPQLLELGYEVTVYDTCFLAVTSYRSIIQDFISSKVIFGIPLCSKRAALSMMFS